MNKSFILMKYLLSNECSDKESKLAALRFHKEYLANIDKKIPSNIYSIYDELGFIPDNNRYDSFIEKLSKEFDITGNILEVAGGNLPRLGERIAKKQIELGNGRITVIDPELSVSTSKYSNLVLCKEEFTLDTNIKNFDLIISLFPCEATELTIYKSFNENKNFFIRLCDCIHQYEDFSEDDYNYFLNNPKKYRKMLIDGYINYAKHFKRKLKVLDEQSDSPIIMSKKK